MKTATLLRLGGLSVILAQLFMLTNNALYLLSGKQSPDTFRSLMSVLGWALLTPGLMALYASVAQRSGVAGLIGFALFLLSCLGHIAIWTMTLAVAQGITTSQQINQVSLFQTTSTVII